jgi:ADP-ribose pyrophosphatase YjhB (NUDIX family)
MHFHPKPDDDGKQVAILHPSQPSPINYWANATEAATVVPEGPMPAELNGIAFQPWQAPTSDEKWAAVEGQAGIEEPPFTVPPGKHAAAGVVVIEPDGRIWLVSPTNGHGGYKHTFPKGRPETGASLQATAIREAFEESGLKVEINGFLVDLPRSTTRTRYYSARRVAGNPSDMGWESQAVHLVPRSRLAKFLTNPNDAPFIKLLGG